MVRHMLPSQSAATNPRIARSVTGDGGRSPFGWCGGSTRNR